MSIRNTLFAVLVSIAFAISPPIASEAQDLKIPIFQGFPSCFVFLGPQQRFYGIDLEKTKANCGDKFSGEIGVVERIYNNEFAELRTTLSAAIAYADCKQLSAAMDINDFVSFNGGFDAEMFLQINEAALANECIELLPRLAMFAFANYAVDPRLDPESENLEETMAKGFAELVRLSDEVGGPYPGYLRVLMSRVYGPDDELLNSMISRFCAHDLNFMYDCARLDSERLEFNSKNDVGVPVECFLQGKCIEAPFLEASPDYFRYRHSDTQE